MTTATSCAAASSRRMRACAPPSIRASRSAGRALSSLEKSRGPTPAGYPMSVRRTPGSSGCAAQDGTYPPLPAASLPVQDGAPARWSGMPCPSPLLFLRRRRRCCRLARPRRRRLRPRSRQPRRPLMSSRIASRTTPTAGLAGTPRTRRASIAASPRASASIKVGRLHVCEGEAAVTPSADLCPQTTCHTAARHQTQRGSVPRCRHPRRPRLLRLPSPLLRHPRHPRHPQHLPATPMPRHVCRRRHRRHQSHRPSPLRGALKSAMTAPRPSVATTLRMRASGTPSPSAPCAAVVVTTGRQMSSRQQLQTPQTPRPTAPPASTARTGSARSDGGIARSRTATAVPRCAAHLS